jgi:Fic family protein
MQGLLYGRVSSLGFDSKLRAMAENLTYDVVYSSEIEGLRLNMDQVRSSIARRLGIDNVKRTVT